MNNIKQIKQIKTCIGKNTYLVLIVLRFKDESIKNIGEY